MTTIQLTTEAMIGIIVGCVIGGVLIFFVIGLVVYFCCCRKRRNREKPLTRIEETHSDGYINRALPPAKLGSLPRTELDSDGDTGKAIGYAYPIVGGRPVSYPYFGAPNNAKLNASPPSTTESKSKLPVQRQTSIGLPPNAYRLPGLADKSFSMSDTNLSIVGTVNPAYEETTDDPVSRHVYRTQSLINVDRRENDGSTASTNRNEYATRLAYENMSDTSSTNKKKSIERGEFELKQSNMKISSPNDLEAVDHVYALPNKTKRKAPDQPLPPKGLPRIPLEAPVEEEEPPKSPERSVPTRRSLTSEMSYRAKGNLVTDQAFDFLDGYVDEGRKS